MKHKQIKSLFNLELKDLNAKQGLVSFYFAAWNTDLDNDIILKTAYNKTFKENKNNIYHNRDHSAAVGMPISFGTDENGAFAVSQLAMKTIAGNDTFEQYQAGLIKGHSQEFETILDEMNMDTMIRTIKEVRLWGVTSVTHIPANLDTPTISMKSYEDAADYLKKINSLLSKGKISDELGEKFLAEYKMLTGVMDTYSTLRDMGVAACPNCKKVIGKMPQDQKCPDCGQFIHNAAMKSIDFNYLVEKFK